ncbi:RICIN domain-containing protein [Pelobium manganitolerans]|uniref:RICIN domain-containing protein n=1 Tax=Pelobium manganitolerans TaxID=1842495 RepID=UPI003FA3CCAB
MKKKLKSLCVVLLILSIGACKKEIKTTNGEENASLSANKKKVAATLSINHPGMLHTAADFNRIIQKVNAGAEPWLSGWNKLVANSHSSSSYTMQGPTVMIIRGSTTLGSENYSKVMNDAAAAYQNALRWKIAGTTANANKAIQILNAWANTCTSIEGDSNQSLASGLYGYQLANAAEIMRDYSGWSSTDFNKFKAFMVDVFYSDANDFLVRHHNTCSTHYWANWDLCNMATILSIGILCDDQAKVDQAINYFKSGVGTGQIGRLVPFMYPDGLGQSQEAGRDQGHATLDISLLGAFCQMSVNVGQDMFVYNPWNEPVSRVEAICEYTAKYNLNQSVPYTTYNNCENSNQTVISSAGRGTIRPAWELIYNYFNKVRKRPMTYSGQFATLVRPEGGGGDYGSTSGGFDQLGFGTLLYTKDTPAQPIADGIYKITNKTSAKLLDNLGATNNGDIISQWGNSTSNNQRWEFTYNGGYYKIKNVSSGKFIDSAGNTADGSEVKQWASSSSTNQQWSLVPTGDGFYRIKNRANGKYIDCAGSTANGVAMKFYGNSSSSNQIWTLNTP